MDVRKSIIIQAKKDYKYCIVHQLFTLNLLRVNYYDNDNHTTYIYLQLSRDSKRSMVAWVPLATNKVQTTRPNKTIRGLL